MLRLEQTIGHIRFRFFFFFFFLVPSWGKKKEKGRYAVVCLAALGVQHSTVHTFAMCSPSFMRRGRALSRSEVRHLRMDLRDNSTEPR